MLFPKSVTVKKQLKRLRPMSEKKIRARDEWKAEREARPRAAVVPLTRPVNVARIEVEASPQPKGPAAKPGKHAPTVAEARWMDDIVRYGCIACRIDGGMQRAPAVHHILRGGVRMGHLFTIPLCDPGHHQGGDQFGMVSRHPWKARFEARYGTEAELLAHLRLAIRSFDA